MAEGHLAKAFHRNIIGSKGKNIQHVKSAFDVSVKVPAMDDPSTLIQIEGDKASEALAFIEEKLGFPLSKEPLVMATLEAGVEDTKKVVGNRCEKIAEVHKFGVGLLLPRNEGDKAKVQGPPSGVAKVTELFSSVIGRDVAAAAPSQPKPASKSSKSKSKKSKAKKGGKIAECLFFGDAEADDARDLEKFLDILASGDNTLDIAVFTITCNRIANTIKKEFERGVNVRIITDDQCADALGSDVHKLAAAGIPVKQDTSPGHFHHKFAVIDGTVLINGSFNWTRGASNANYENVMVTNDPDLVQPFVKEFEEKWNNKKFVPLA